eukprot:348514_1
MATNYAFVVTWTYFTIYVVLFLMVSVACAFAVRSKYIEAKNKNQGNVKWSVAKLFQIWIKLLWRKKKVYLQLIPHFFDQATDLGVIFEYHKLRNEDDIGINTMYLFVVSIWVLIFHRMISSAAIYHLTKKPIDMVYQMFDLLMIRSIWTNYKLESDEPSNSQRYLQIMEATFESAPQILISTAFLIKTSSSRAKNPIVIVSLITSFWSLSSRVSGDDKLMFQEEWKSARKSSFPFVNHRYFIRVFLWRFLEISSRIILLCLMWINLGGLSVFIVLAVEFIYLSVICFGLQSVLIMGNIIYLVAANSNKKSEDWAMLMTRIFWSYRVLSSYVYLILVTVFAMTRFDAPKINDYQTRHDQTINDRVGFAIYIYCWIATPIWQWIGAVIVFDYNNIGSVGRDVDQLMADGKLLDVLELISFGANFNAQTLDKIISNERCVCATCEHMFGSHIDDNIMHTTSYTQQNKAKDLLFDAAYHDNAHVMEYLLDKTDVTVNVQDDQKRTPLFYAAAQNHIQFVTTLIDKHNASCSINVLHYKLTSTEFPCNENKNLEIIEMLVEKGNFEIDINTYNIAKNAQQPRSVLLYLNHIGGLKQNAEEYVRYRSYKSQPFAVKHIRNTTPTKWMERNYDKPILDWTRRICVVVLMSLAFLAAIFGADIAALVINSKNDCNGALINESEFVFFDVNEFILGGCITHLGMSVLIVCCGWCALSFKENVSNVLCSVCACYCCFACWLISWSVIGVLIHLEMDTSDSKNEQCADAILSWSIISLMQVVVSPFGVYEYLNILMHDSSD